MIFRLPDAVSGPIEVRKDSPVSFGFLRFSAIGGVFILLAGCGSGSGNTTGGGGGGGGGNNPTTVTFTVTGGTLSGGSLTLSVPSGTTNFAVAFVCPPLTSYTPPETEQYVYEASTLDGTSFSEWCLGGSSNEATGTLTGAVDASRSPGLRMLEFML
jgi:hypothetical protein